MEPQEYNNNNKCCFKNKCLEIIKDILLVAFFVVLGIIIGASVAEAILGALAAVIVLNIIPITVKHVSIIVVSL